MLTSSLPTSSAAFFAAITFDTAPYFYFFGAVSLLLGIIGYVKAKSKASLIAGGVAGILLIVGAFWGSRNGHIVELVVSALLTGRFLPTFLKSKKLYPGGIMTVLAIIGVVLAALELI